MHQNRNKQACCENVSSRICVKTSRVKVKSCLSTQVKHFPPLVIKQTKKYEIWLQLISCQQKVNRCAARLIIRIFKSDDTECRKQGKGCRIPSAAASVCNSTQTYVRVHTGNTCRKCAELLRTALLMWPLKNRSCVNIFWNTHVMPSLSTSYPGDYVSQFK